MKKQTLSLLLANPLICYPEDADRALAAEDTMNNVSQVLSTVEELVGQFHGGLNLSGNQTGGFWKLISCARTALDFEVAAASAYREQQSKPRKPRTLKATPERLRDIRSRLSKAKSMDDLNPIHAEIERLPKKHADALGLKWGRRAAEIVIQSPAFKKAAQEGAE